MKIQKLATKLDYCVHVNFISEIIVDNIRILVKLK